MAQARGFVLPMVKTPVDPKRSCRLFRAGSGRERKGLLRNSEGLAYLEFAISLPVLLVLGLYGTELAYMASINMQVSQIASSVADNASRIGQTDNSGVTPTVTEAEIDSVLGGAILQGRGIKFNENGRIVLSSLEQDPSSKKQYIHWQRCRGTLAKESSYGPEGYGKTTGNLLGMGKEGALIKASGNSSVMFAEVFYSYKGLFGDMFVGTVEFKQEMAFETRDDRNLTPGVTGDDGDSECS
ncbi:pilus assembly protein TadE [Novosphingobium sp.]|uniref:TadE/TadG family type IV pilus assembly protein n=1 Tax=Novosphingobium sp. TaxID=1874826 RepID=UPI0026105550|nr:pilus assembly protein TadE [Novosphingobium sp.]